MEIDAKSSEARAAQLNGPKHLCVDLEDNVIIADAENDLVRKYVPSTGKIHRVAGTGRRGSAGVGGAPEQCGWLRDKYGVSWQIVPVAAMNRMMQAKEPKKLERVWQAIQASKGASA